MKTRTKKKLGITLIALVILIVAGIFLVPKFINPNRYTPRIVELLEDATGGKVRIGHISWGISYGVWLEADGFSMVDPSFFPMDIKLNRVFANVSILPLLTKKVDVNKLILEGSQVKLTLKPDKVEEQQNEDASPSVSPERKATSDEKALPGTSPPKTIETQGVVPSTADTTPDGIVLPVEIEIEELTVAIDRVEIDDALTIPDQRLMRVFTDVDISASKVVPGEEISFNLALRDETASGLGKITAEGTFEGLTDRLVLENPNLRVKVGLTGLYLATVKRYLEKSPLQKRLDGIVSMEIDYDGDLSENHRLEGKIDLSELTYTDPTLWDAPLPGQKTTLHFNTVVDPQNITVENVALESGGLALSARAQVKSWDKDPMIKNAELSYDLPLTELIPLIPWKSLGENVDVIRPILEGGGKITSRKVILPDLDPNVVTTKYKDLLSEIEMETQIVGLSAKPSPDLPRIEDITGTVHLSKGIARVKGLRARLGSVDLPEVSAKITNLLDNPKIDAGITGQLKVGDTFQKEFGETLERFGLERLIGEADVDLALVLESDRPEDFQVQGNIELKDILVKTVFSPAIHHGINADIDVTPEFAHLSRFSSTVTLKEGATSPNEQYKLELDSRIDDWRKKPIITLNNLKTSPISLSLLASMIPWDRLGHSSEPIKKALMSGGTLTIENLALPKIDPANLPEDPRKVLPKVKLAAVFDDVTVPSIKKTTPTIQGITGRVNLENDTLIADKVSAKVGPISLPTIDVHATKISSKPKGSLSVKGPLHLAAATNAEGKKLLNEYGFKSLTGSAEVDIQAEYDQARPESWVANGSLILKGVRAESHPAGVIMDNLKGGLKFNRKQAMDVTIEDVRAMINKAPVKVSGKFLRIGKPNMLVTTQVSSKRLDLAQLAELVPTLKDLNLGGTVNMNMSVHFPYDTPLESSLNGTMTTQNVGFRIDASNLLIKKVNSQLELAGQDARIKTMTMQVNDQQMSLSGKLSNPVEPSIQLLVHSPNLNLDRLLPQTKTDKQASEPVKGDGAKGKKEPPPEGKAGKAELPPMVRKTTADIEVRADQGRYRRIQFQKLNMNIQYKQGVIETYDLNFGTENGQIGTKGNADLRDLNHIAFAMEPDIQGLDLERLASVYDIEKLPLTGSMSVKGQLQGRTGGSTKELLGSLDGHLNVKTGPGRIKEVGKVGTLLGRIFSMASLQSIFSGRMLQDLSGEGIRYNALNADTTFTKGLLDNKIQLGSDAMNVDSEGTIDLVNETIKTKALLEPLATVNKALDFVPILGKAAGDLIKVRIDVEGPLDDPKIKTSQIKQVGTAVKSVGEGTGDFIKGIGKGIEKLFGK